MFASAFPRFCCPSEWFIALQGIAGYQFSRWGILPVEQWGGTAGFAAPWLSAVTILWLWMSWWAPEDARYSTSYCCFLSGKSIVIIVFYIYIEGENGPCNHSCRLWCSFSYFWVCAFLLCQEQRKCLFKTFTHELVKMKRILGEI